MPLARRTRRLSLDELVAGALILYPRYFDTRTGVTITVDEAIEQLQTVHAQRSFRDAWWRPLFRAVLRRVVGVR